MVRAVVNVCARSRAIRKRIPWLNTPKHVVSDVCSLSHGDGFSPAKKEKKKKKEKKGKIYLALSDPPQSYKFGVGPCGDRRPEGKGRLIFGPLTH